MSGNGVHPTVPPFPHEYRASGLLLYVTSLPSSYGIGDLGSAAFSLVDRSTMQVRNGGRLCRLVRPVMEIPHISQCHRLQEKPC